MDVVRSLKELRKEENSVVTVGTFDGVHRAHQEIVREAIHRAKMREGRSVVVTFEPHPKEVVPSKNGPVFLLTTIDERIELLGKQGVDLLYIIDFTFEFSQLSSRAFYERFLVNGTGVSEVVVGYDHMFGRNREGTSEDLVRMGKDFDFSVFAFHPYTVNGEIVSSTQIRKALAEGNIERANAFLGREYSMRGTVVHGDGRGKTIGYPTANIQPESDKKMIPANGVYLVGVAVGNDTHFGMMNIGVRPTVTDAGGRMVEVHLFNFSSDVYGERLSIEFIKRLRSEQRFASLGELTRQLDKDKVDSLKYIAEFMTRH